MDAYQGFSLFPVSCCFFPAMPKIVPCYFLQGKATKTHIDRGLYDDPVWSFLSNIDFSLFFSLLAGNRGVGDGFDYDCVRHQSLRASRIFPETASTRPNLPAFAPQ